MDSADSERLRSIYAFCGYGKVHAMLSRPRLLPVSRVIFIFKKEHTLRLSSLLTRIQKERSAKTKEHPRFWLYLHNRIARIPLTHRNICSGFSNGLRWNGFAEKITISIFTFSKYARLGWCYFLARKLSLQNLSFKTTTKKGINHVFFLNFEPRTPLCESPQVFIHPPYLR